MRIKIIMLVFAAIVIVTMAAAGGKRTILTSGEKVYTIHYQLGQSTILFFGTKPETVICGNKNYFNIEKIKEGLTIQPLSNFSTNLTVLTEGKRFLFYLTPTKGEAPDTFVDVRWIPDNETHPVLQHIQAKETFKYLSQKASIGKIEFILVKIVSIATSRRVILEYNIKNMSDRTLKTSELEIQGLDEMKPIIHQVSVFDKDEILPNSQGMGRLILTDSKTSKFYLAVKYQGKSIKIQIQKGMR